MTCLYLSIVSTNYTWKRSHELLVFNRTNYVCLRDLHYLRLRFLDWDNAIAIDCFLPRPSFINIDIFFPMFFFPYFKGIYSPVIIYVGKGRHLPTIPSIKYRTKWQRISHWFNWYISCIIIHILLLLSLKLMFL